MGVTKDVTKQQNSEEDQIGYTSAEEEAFFDGGVQKPPLIARLKSNMGPMGMKLMPWSPCLFAGVVLVTSTFVAVAAFTGARRAAEAAAGETAWLSGPLPPGASARPTCSRPGVCPLMFLFESPDILDTATANIMKVGSAFMAPSDARMARDVVRMIFGNISQELKTNAPSVASELMQIDLSEREKKAVVHLMNLMTDERVQSIGMEVTVAIRDSPRLDSRDFLKKQIEQRLMPRLEEILGLRLEVPEELRQVWRDLDPKDQQWEMSLDPQNVRSMQAVTGEVVLQHTPESFPDDAKKYFAASGGALEEGRALLDILQKCIRSMGPQWTVDIGNTMQFQPAPLDWPCSYDKKDSRNPHVDYMKAVICPLKFGAQGVDALRAADEMAVPDGTYMNNQ